MRSLANPQRVIVHRTRREVVVEVHGHLSRRLRHQRRQNLIWECGWQLRRFPARLVRRNPRLVVAEIQAFLAA